MAQSGGKRKLRNRLSQILMKENFSEAVLEIQSLPPKQVLNRLFSLLMDSNNLVRWRAAKAMGVVIARLGDTDIESARVIMRRLLWSLNDESGGIGWGSPEVMSEAMSLNSILAREYGSIFLSYLDEKGNFLEYAALQRGLLWGLVNLAKTRPQIVLPALSNLGKYFLSQDADVRGFAAMAAGELGDLNSLESLKKLLDDESELTFLDGGNMVTETVGGIALRSLDKLSSLSNDSSG
jgi:HEAT repeat protein